MYWEAVIGLEVHVQLNTQSKIFSNAPAQAGQVANQQVSLVDLAMPGVLPVLNEAVIEKAIRLGIALTAYINQKNVFARKNYFYPDLPKGYQISQMDLPIIQGGTLSVAIGTLQKTIHITRAHLEEDAGKLLHNNQSGLTGIDLNRAGIPLLEIVSEPDMRSPEEAVAYARTLHKLVTWLDISAGDMEAGNFRIDANVSVRKKNAEKFGTRREIKNLNSFHFLEEAIQYEIAWQINCLKQNKTIEQTTVLFDEKTGKTCAMRSKENAHDYRYFPDPDLPPMIISDEQIENVRRAMPKLPHTIKAHFINTYHLSDYDANLLTAQPDIAIYFEKVATISQQAKLAANWINGEFLAYLNKQHINCSETTISAQTLATLITKIAEGKLSHKLAKQVFDKMTVSSLSVDHIIQQEGLENITDSNEINQWVTEVIANNLSLVQQFHAGKEKTLNALVGQVIKRSSGKANPNQVQNILRKHLTQSSK